MDASSRGSLWKTTLSNELGGMRGQGHMAIITAPDLVADEVARFLSA